MTLSCRRPGYTLLEVVLVAAVLVIVSAMAVPSIDGMYGYFKLNAAVDGVQAAWALGRAHAIEEGVPYRFCVVPGQGNYRLAPDTSDYWSGNTPALTDPDNPPAVVEDALAQGVTFAMGGNGQAPDVAPNEQTSMPVGQVDAGSWSTVAVFLPDGTARDDVEILFQVKGAMPTRIFLRALTGRVTVKTDGQQ
jgi:prepilin-type N-terminal cleavage/methylation domain-containing protein